MSRFDFILIVLGVNILGMIVIILDNIEQWVNHKGCGKLFKCRECDMLKSYDVYYNNILIGKSLEFDVVENLILNDKASIDVGSKRIIIHTNEG